MYYLLFSVLLVMLPLKTFAQEKVWIHVEQGIVLYLSPLNSDWEPVTGKDQIPERSYITTKSGVKAHIFKEASAYDVPENAYFFVDDLFERNRLEVIDALVRIEAEQLPVNPDGADSTKTLGLIYGAPIPQTSGIEAIPFHEERLNAINWFLHHNQQSAALLSIKRTLTKYPRMYLDQNYIERLLSLYSRFELYGYLFEESNRLLMLRTTDTYKETVRAWHNFAQERLREQGK